MTESYSLRDVGKLLGLSRSVVCGLIDAGFVTPTRGPRREFRFTFPDLVLLRAAQALSEASIAPARIVRSLRRLRAQLPEQAPLSGLRIAALGDRVVVSEGEAQWQPDSGQYLLPLGDGPQGGRAAVIEVAPRREAGDARGAVDAGAAATLAPSAHDGRGTAADAWFQRGLALEGSQPEEACIAYQRAIEADPRDVDAYVNLGRLLHELRRLGAAEAAYRSGLDRCRADATLLYNLAVLQEDLAQPEAAARSYRAALDVARDFADAHFNLARLCASQGLEQEAVRHWSAFRRLTS